MIRMGHVIVCPMIFALLSNQVRKDGELKLMKNDVLSIFRRLGPFRQISGHFTAWIILSSADIFNSVSLILCPIVFCL